jgi:glycosyltransferase involved in cell wall biosynthesis
VSAVRSPSVVVFPFLTLPEFVKRDAETLRSRYAVRLIGCTTIAGTLQAMNAVRKSDLLVCWFGSLRFLPIVVAATVLRKPVCVIAGGYDVAALPQIAYGTMGRPLSRLLGRWLFAMADVVAAFSASAGKEAVENAGVRSDRLRVIPLGFDDEPVRERRKEPFILCVANIDESTVRRKGLLGVAELSARMPGTRFVLAGAGSASALAQLRAAGGANLELPGWVSADALEELYARAKVYLQPSLHEGFGSSVAEAMLHNCIPVVTPRSSLREIVGPCGLFAEPDDLEAIEARVHEALEEDFVPPEPPRARILRVFPSAARRRDLLELLSSLLDAASARSDG